MANMLPILRKVAPVRGASAAEHLAELARQALVAEAELTPKPGLVDRRGTGAHADLSLDLMRRSASAIAPYFADMGDSLRNQCHSTRYCVPRLPQSEEPLKQRCFK